MRLLRLDIHDLRCLQSVTLEPEARLNLITGPNGAGKTSVLEAIHLLGYGRSFRCRVRDGLIRAGAPAVAVFAESASADATSVRRIGLRHAGSTWEGRLDGAAVQQLGDLCAALAVVTFEPGSHALVTGSGEPRRRQLDWGLFHVEHGDPSAAFLSHWRRYQRALKQRNRLLKAGAPHSDQLDAWDHELAQSGEALTRSRLHYLDRLLSPLQQVSAQLSPMLGLASLQYQPGWPRESLDLADSLLLARDRDLQHGHTSVGPHRADWRIAHAALPGGEALSRGQAKLVALSLLLAQARLHGDSTGHWPIILLDDLASELDRQHQSRVLQQLQDSGAQVFLTGTEQPEAVQTLGLQPRMFHVEQGRISA